MATPDTPRNDDQQNDPLDDTTFETTAGDTSDDTQQLEQTVHSDTTHQSETTEQFEGTEQFDRTEQLDGTDATRALGVGESTTGHDLFGNPVHHADTPFATSSAAVADEHVIAPLPDRPTGPHAPAIVLGLVCLAVAGIILAQELGSLTVDWGDIGPFGIVLTGAVLVLFGLVGLLTSRRNSKTS